ncbi:3',5'-cyclic-nucleotide phosphodiesterase [Marinospirillum alkaliphilum]|uniref:Beta-lactamase superfamily domain-containing protein n=1 Tax=Marinospirillum alkaliphilum DSM 21637 TaxID=1122209 RepID=A0A1K1Y719_9GAMM|nr:3',5'-cyclic-nucleotide phosphodiesterase [Marinospirillum alkaliphilum]SFX57534.1 Beta-lactamase superfamily domain-containing protein [Marinospirillum alkaliphilum DSM 21637]
MKVEILGCSGGMGLGQHTTCYRINEHTLMDAGSGLGNLPQDELKKIRHILITHSHLDHICFLPLLIDNLFEFLKQPIHVYALPEVLEILKQHIFNWKIWPDFATLPNQDHPVVRFHTVQAWQPVVVGDLTFTAFPVEHIVPTCGYHVVSETGHTLAFTGDTTYGTAVMQELNKLGQLDVLMTECAFPDRLLELAHVSKHLTPKLVKDFVDAMAYRPRQVWLSHLKPSQTHEIRAELEKLDLSTKLVLLQTGQVFQL